jgi:predicted nucleic acid-binding protein
MILVDSSVWIDYFRGSPTPQADLLDGLLARELLAVGDLILTEVLQGFASERDFNQARKLLTSLEIIELGGPDNALAAARNFRTLRARGFTIRKTIDTLIATCCIENDLALLYSDRDFDPFVIHLGLRSALAEQSGSPHMIQQERARYGPLSPTTTA